MLPTVLPNPRFRRPIGLLLTSTPRLSKPYSYFATFVLLLTYLPRNVLEIGHQKKIFDGSTIKLIQGNLKGWKSC